MVTQWSLQQRVFAYVSRRIWAELHVSYLHRQMHVSAQNTQKIEPNTIGTRISNKLPDSKLVCILTKLYLQLQQRNLDETRLYCVGIRVCTSNSDGLKGKDEPKNGLFELNGVFKGTK